MLLQFDSSQFTYRAPSSSDETQHLGDMLAQCFIGAPSDSQVYIDRIGSENFRLLRKNGSLVGGLALIPMGQWWHGQRVAMTGIASVGVAPDQRGTGTAIVLLQQMLQELYDTGVPISVLYPATQRLYRKVGYEQGGTYTSWSVPTAEIQMRERLLPLHPVDAVTIEAFATLQQQQAQRHNGNLDRHSAIWQGFLKAETDQPLYAYWIGDIDYPQGYVIFSQNRANEQATLRIRDWSVLSVAASKTLWTFLADHRSMVDKIHWRGAAIDFLALLLPEQSPKLESSMKWMLRIINVRSALEQRGYPPGVETELHLDIEDDLLRDNHGKFILSVSQGRGQVTSGGTGEIKLGVRGLASLYSGLYSPHQLQSLGFLNGSDAALSIASYLFSGSSPWLPDFF